MNTLTTTIESPIGPLTLTANEGRLTRLFMNEQRHAPSVDTSWRSDRAFFATVEQQLAAYFGGELIEFDVELGWTATSFQHQVWNVLRTIPYGETISYGELARRIGNPNASRAVGLANGKNPIGIIVPCHRVIATSGHLTGYAGGIERKAWLLHHESHYRMANVGSTTRLF